MELTSIEDVSTSIIFANTKIDSSKKTFALDFAFFWSNAPMSIGEYTSSAVHSVLATPERTDLYDSRRHPNQSESP